MPTMTAVDYSALVNYTGVDPSKIACQKAGLQTASNLSCGFKEETWSRGESAYVVRMPGKTNRYLAHVEEGLGTLSILSDQAAKAVRTAIHQNELPSDHGCLAGKSFYFGPAQSNVAMAINDLITVGAAPLTYELHLAVESDKWFENERRMQELIDGTRTACDIAGCSWGGGETPILRSIVQPGASLLSGSATGYISCKKRLINPSNIQHGDAIIMFESSGVHANGISMLWDVIAPRLPYGYLTEVPEDGRSFAEVITEPTVIYARLIQAILDAGISIHYAVNITGHGWCKLMRAKQPFIYIISQLPRLQPLFRMIQQYNPISIKKMYRTFNMGGGFAIYVAQKDVDVVLHITENVATRLSLPFRGICAGTIKKSSKRRVVIEPEGVVFEEEDLEIR